MANPSTRRGGVYPIEYIDAVVVKVRTDGTVINRAAYLGIGVDVEALLIAFGFV